MNKKLFKKLYRATRVHCRLTSINALISESLLDCTLINRDLYKENLYRANQHYISKQITQSSNELNQIKSECRLSDEALCKLITLMLAAIQRKELLEPNLQRRLENKKLGNDYGINFDGDDF